MSKIRLYLDFEKLSLNQEIKIIDNNFDYLTKVMRRKIGDKIFIFNNLDGEFAAEIIDIAKKNLAIKITEKTADFNAAENFTLAFALIKNANIETIAKKATELGVKNFQPIITQHSVVDKINENRFKANIKEAAEQCERVDLANLYPIKKLNQLLDEKFENEKIFILCDESKKNDIKTSEILTKISQIKNIKNLEKIILIGPEGGFSEEEFNKMSRMKNLFSISLGKNILKADTAAIAALTICLNFI
jgi:16S rRNA (uracil1498-N3)-methyltransferase